MIRKRALVLALLAAALAGQTALRGQQPVSKEYLLKAAFLYNFTKFVEWPSSSWLEPQSPIVIGVFGGNPFGSFLEETVLERRINGRVLVVRTVTSAEQARATHLLFVSKAVSAEDLAQLQGAVAGLPVLTVGESPAFARQGGMITFELQEDRIRFEINAGAAQRSGLKLSSQLLKLATVVK